MYDLKPGQLVECEWLDPAAGSGWRMDDDSKFWKIVCRSIGYVYSTSEDGLLLVASDATDPDGDKSTLFRQSLPWGSITNLWILEN